MAVTRAETHHRVLGAVEVSDQGLIEVTVGVGVEIFTLAEAEEFARQIQDAVIEADVINNEGNS